MPSQLVCPVRKKYAMLPVSWFVENIEGVEDPKISDALGKKYSLPALLRARTVYRITGDGVPENGTVLLNGAPSP